MKTHIDELVDEEMRSGTEIERNDFKIVIETFTEQMKIVAQEIEDSVHFQKTKATESLAAICLENSLDFQLDDKLIPGGYTPSSFTSSSIALISQSQKQKPDLDFTKPSTNVVLINSSFKEVVIALANVYCSNVSTQNTKLASLVTQIKKKMNLIKNSLEEVKSSLGDMKDMLKNISEMIGGVLEALAKINAIARLGPSIGGVAQL